MRILVLGGTAFLSAEIARQALDAGHEVTCLARGTAAAPPAGARWLQADRSAGKAAYTDAENTGWDAVVDVSRNPEHAREALEVLAGTARHWTFISSCSVYADHSVAGAAEGAELLPPLAAGTGLTMDNYGEAKAAIEHRTRELAGDKAHICRPGLLGGPGDSSDRYGYWPARFARDQEPVLIPDIPSDPTQVIDVRDLAAWVLAAAGAGTIGTLNAVGETVPFAAYLEEARQLSDQEAEVVAIPGEWLAEHGANYWAGPDSLPLWLPPGQDGFLSRSNDPARAAGLRLRPWMDTVRDALADERQRGLGRERKAGLSPETERRLLREYRAETA
ncbi:2'-hydroxyisoflavone reductase [Arthrobacter sp. B3I9]|uniref:NAD-dependent epimerase/dehydratase family protein n=1 Tax=Arthrobacter sp. B3I9 TaxID=3042270 RepID=UPI00278E44EE|nr:NAD-dependent epimerase/dehydratase family protein [Arthrobacter sp. B3I9]MDQ0849853.1 2'-hydroxyisoflavone reductase [Arthrobacter sp. B3I9]